MAEENTGAETTETKATETVETTETKKEGGESGAGDGKGGEGDGKTETKESPKVDDTEEPQARKSNAWWVAQRRGNKIEKLSKKEGDTTETPEGKEKKEDDEDEYDLDKKLDERLDQRLEERLEPLKKEAEEKEIDSEISSFTTENPEFKPYAAKVKKWATHESRKSVPVSSIFYEVAGKDLMKLGAERAKKADEEARNSQGSGGGTGAGDGTPKSVWDMTPEEFAAEQLRLRSNPPIAE